MYGMGKHKLSNMLGLEYDEAMALINKYNDQSAFC